MSHVYDKAKWHLEGDYPEDLPEINAYTHTGLYLGWLIDNVLISDSCRSDWQQEIKRFQTREITGPQLFAIIDGVLDESMLNEVGNRFSKQYFDFGTGEYLDDYQTLLASGLPSLYHVEDSWSNQEVLSAQLSKRFRSWRRSDKKHWWRFGAR